MPDEVAAVPRGGAAAQRAHRAEARMGWTARLGSDLRGKTDGVRAAAARRKAVALMVVWRRGGRWLDDLTGGDGGFGQRQRARAGTVGTDASLWCGAACGSVALARRPSAVRGMPGGDGALTSGPGAEREKLTVGSRVIVNSRIQILPKLK
jgi:hypothetical protein